MLTSKKIPIIVTVLLVFISVESRSQNVGLSFSFFFPKNGEFSTPISPFSFRGVGVNLNDFVGIETGFSLYRMTGMSVKDLPFESEKSIVGPNFTVLVPLELVLSVRLNVVELSVKGGGFGFYAFDNKINKGNMDAALVTWDQVQAPVVDSNFNGSSAVGFGYHFGGEVIVYATSSFGVSLEANYFIGGADFPLEGSYDYFNGSQVVTVNESFEDSQIDMTGLEISIGLLFSGNNNSGGRSRRRRR